MKKDWRKTFKDMATSGGEKSNTNSYVNPNAPCWENRSDDAKLYILDELGKIDPEAVKDFEAFLFEHERRHREAEARFKRREELKRIARDFAVNPEIEKIMKEKSNEN